MNDFLNWPKVIALIFIFKYFNTSFFLIQTNTILWQNFSDDRREVNSRHEPFGSRLKTKTAIGITVTTGTLIL